MAINIMEQLQGQLGSQLVGPVAKQLDESEQATRSGISALIPTILGGLLKQVSIPSGADKLDKTLRDGGYDGGQFDNISSTLTQDGSTSSATRKGSDLIAMLLGDKVATLVPIIANTTGMKASSVTSLLPILAPLVMSLLGKQQKTMGLDANGLKNLLMSQKDTIMTALPSGVADAIGLGALDTAGPTGNRTGASVPAAGGSGVLLKVLIPLVLLAAVGYGCYWYIFDGIRPTGAAGNIVVEPGDDLTIDYRMQSSARGPRVETSDAAATSIDSPGTVTTPDIKSIFDSISATIGRVTDVESAEAALPELESANKNLENVIAQYSTMSETPKGKLSHEVIGMLPDMQSMIDKAMGISGVKEILQPILDKVTAGAKSLTT